MLRDIDVSEVSKSFPAYTEDDPILSFVPVETLRIDDAYQRQIERAGWKNIQRIAENFSWSRFSPLLLAPLDDGLHAVIDGQHRAHAAALRGIELVPAVVVPMTRQEQARAFSWVNGSVTALSAIQVYRAALAAMEPWALQCDVAVARAGCELMTSHSSSVRKRPGKIYCITTIKGFVEAGHAQTLSAVLEGLRLSPDGQDVASYAGRPIAALVSAAVALGVARSDCITQFLTHKSLSTIEKAVRVIMARPDYSRKPFTSLYNDSIRAELNAWLKRGAVR